MIQIGVFRANQRQLRNAPSAVGRGGEGETPHVPRQRRDCRAAAAASALGLGRTFAHHCGAAPPLCREGAFGSVVRAGISDARLQRDALEVNRRARVVRVILRRLLLQLLFLDEALTSKESDIVGSRPASFATRAARHASAPAPPPRLLTPPLTLQLDLKAAVPAF